MHPSLLPKYRGAAPIQWTIINGDTTTGVTVQSLVEREEGIDCGAILGIKADIVSPALWLRNMRSALTIQPVPPDATYASLMPTLAEAGAEVLVDVLRRTLRDEVSVTTHRGISRSTRIRA